MKTDLEYTLSSHRLPALAVPRTIEEELEWIFDRGAEGQPPKKAHPSDAWEAIALRTIGGWLAAIDAYDATMLEAAFGPVEWPRALRRRLGCLTGVVVRLASVDAGWPPGKDDQRRLVERVARELDEERSAQGPRGVTRHIAPGAGRA